MIENISDTLKKLNIHCPKCNSKNYYRYKNGELRCQRCSFVYSKDSEVKSDLSDIKKVSNIHCPKCNSKNYYRYKNGELRCQRCSFVYNDNSIKDVPINKKEQIVESSGVENLLKKTTDPNKEYPIEHNHTLPTSFHKEIGAFRKLKRERAAKSKEYLEGYIDGFRLVLELVEGDLCDEPIEGYSLADFGNDYISHAEFIETKDCLNCIEPGKNDCSKLGMYCPLDGEDPDDFASKEYLKGYIDGFITSLYDVGLEIGEGILCDDPEDEYNVADYGEDYGSHANFIGTKDCLNCEKPGKDEFSELGRLCPLMCF